MKQVFIVSNENRNKAEELLKKDDEINRGSIMIKEIRSLGIDEKGYFIILDADEDVIKKAKKLLKDQNLGEEYKEKGKVLVKIKEQEDAAIQGFGNILGS